MPGNVVVAGTWGFSAQPVAVAARLATEGRSCEDCVEAALNVAEEDESYGVYQVGCGGWPNTQGEVELDAAIMSGECLAFGAVTALQGVCRASSVARCVMETSSHSMLTSQGAQQFALHSGFHLHTPSAQESSKQGSKVNQASGEHDTLGIIVLDGQGNIAAGVTSSGMKYKAQGRIGDSALPGSGLYADNEVGAVCCSGEGDQIMKFCPSFMVLEFMRQGMTPNEACQTAVRRILKRIKPCPPFELAILAVNMQGDVGAATSVREWKDVLSGQSYSGFPFAVWQQNGKKDVDVQVVGPVPECVNYSEERQTDQSAALAAHPTL